MGNYVFFFVSLQKIFTMKAILIFCLLFFSISFLSAQTRFEYDASGNRMNRVIVLSSPAQAPSQAPPRPPSEENDEDEIVSEDEENFELDEEDIFSSFTSFPSSEEEDFFGDVFTDKLNESDVIIYPNPTKGALAVEIRNKNPQTQYQLTVLNFNGSIIFQKNHIENYTQIDLSSHPKGVYLLRIFSQDRFITWKIIKE